MERDRAAAAHQARTDDLECPSPARYRDARAALTDVGLKQAEALVHVLCDESIDVLMASTLWRTQQTATPLALARALPIGIREGIREIGAGELEMRGDVAASLRYQATAFTGWPVSSTL